ncbi:MAG: hypothetical protein EOP56_09570 [Sphingobacteriales bacterium]|nr:MAG: hypothetical protein EOP56_09570 [Sphingobacteriales bacterium]
MRLSETWFMEGHIDFELQKYRLLAYLQEVNKYFNEAKLYPQLGDVIFHHNNLLAFRTNKKLLQDQFPQQLNKVDMRNLELMYEKMLADDEVMNELESITNYAVSEMKSIIDNGAEIYELVEKQLRIEPIGIIPLYKNEGYMLLRYGNQSEIKAYSYSITLFEHQQAKYRGIKVNYVDRYTKSLANTYESIKRDIINQIRTLPNPAVYCIESQMQVPLDETLLPIAKRMLVRHIAEAA